MTSALRFAFISASYLLLLLIGSLPVIKSQTIEAEIYVDSEYTGWISTGWKNFPFTDFQKALSSACPAGGSQNKNSVKIVYFTARPTPYTIPSSLFYQNCGYIELKALPQSDQQRAKLLFKDELTVNSSAISFDSFEFLTLEEQIPIIAHLFKAYNGSVKFSNCFFNLHTNDPSYFSYFYGMNVTIDSCNYSLSENSLGNTLIFSETILRNVDFYFEDAPLISTFECFGFDITETSPMKPSSIDGSDIRILPNLTSGLESFSMSILFFVTDTSIRLQRITFDESRNKPLDVEGAQQQLIIAKFITPDLTFEIRDFEAILANPLSPLIRVANTEHNSSVNIILDSIRINRTDVSFSRTPPSSSYEHIIFSSIQIVIQGQNTSIHVNNFEIASSSSSLNSSTTPLNRTSFFSLEIEQPSIDVKFSNLAIQQSIFNSKFLFIKGFISDFIVENVTIFGSKFYNNFLDFDGKFLGDLGKRTINKINWELNHWNLTTVHAFNDFFVLHLDSIQDNSLANLSQMLFLNVKNISVRFFDLQGISPDSRTAFFGLNNVGIKVFDSNFSSLTLRSSLLVFVKDKMVPVMFEGCDFTDIIGTHRSSQFFFKVQTDFYRESHSNGSVAKFYPLINSFCLISNSFSGRWLFDDSPQVFGLNVPSVLIVNNTFTDMIMSVNADFINMKELYEGGNVTAMDPTDAIENVYDPRFRDFFQKYIRLRNTSASSLYVFDQNYFKNVLLQNTNLIFARGLISRSQLIYQNNVMINMTVHASTIPVNVISTPQTILAAIDSCRVLVRNNQMLDSRGYLALFESTLSNDFIAEIHFLDNVLSNNDGVAALVVTGNLFFEVKISNNRFENCTLSTLSLMEITVYTNLLKDLHFYNNTLSDVVIHLDGYNEANLIHMNMPGNILQDVLIENLTVVRSGISYTNGEKNFGVRSSLIHIMNPNAGTKILNSVFVSCGGRGVAFFMSVYSETVEFNSFEIEMEYFPDYMSTTDWESTILLASKLFQMNNSQFSGCSAMRGGVFNFENLLSKDKDPMTILLHNNTFVHNAANEGGVFYFNPKNSLELIFKASENKFLKSAAFDTGGGVFHMENQLINTVEITSSVFYYPFDIVQTGNFLYASKLKPSRRGPNDILFKDVEFLIKCTEAVLSSPRNIHSFIHIEDQDFTAFREVRYVFDNVTFALPPEVQPTMGVSVYGYLIYALASTIVLNNSQVYGLENTRHFLKINSRTRLTVSNSVFSKNAILLYSSNTERQRACFIGITSDENSFDVGFVLLSNTTFTDNSMKGGTLPGNIICILTSHFNVTIKNSTVARNSNDAPVLLSTYQKMSQKKSITRLVALENSIFEGNVGNTLKGGLIDVDFVDLRIRNCTFSNNKGALSGGAFSVVHPLKLHINSSTFTANVVKYIPFTRTIPRGGAVFLGFDSDPVDYSPEIIITGSKFYENVASEGQGGAIYISSLLKPTIMLEILESNVYLHNKALVGDDLSTRPYSMELNVQEKNDPTQYVALGVKSQSAYSEPIQYLYFNNRSLNFTFRDFYNNTLVPLGFFSFVMPDYTIALHIVDSEDAIHSRECTFGWCILPGDALKIKGKENATKIIEADAILHQGAFVKFNTEIKVRKCLPGEVNVTSKEICVLCESGSYSLDPSKSTCHECPLEANCLGGNALRAKPGYWRANNATANFYPCQTPANCKGGVSGDDICVEGRVGPYCLGCDLSNNYARGLANSCSKCSSPWLGTLSVLAFNIGLLLFEIWIIYKMREINLFIIIENKFNEEYLAKLANSGYISIFLLYIQVLSIIKDMSSWASKLVQGFLPVNPSQMLFVSMSCPLRNFGVPLEDVYYWKMSMIALLPFIKLAGFALYGGIIKYFNRSYHLKSFMVIAVVGIAFIEQPGIISKMISMFSCQSTDPKDPNASYFVTISPETYCGSPTFNFFRRYVALPGLLLWGLALPCACYLTLVKNRKRLKTKEFARYFGSIYSVYKSNYYIWPLVQMLVTLTITVISQLGMIDSTSRGMTIILFLVGYLLYLRAAKPYRFNDIYKTDLIATSIFIGTTYLAIYGAVSENWINYIASVIMMGVNLAFLIFVIMKALESVGCAKVVYSLARLLNKCFCEICWGKNLFEPSRDTLQRSESIMSPDKLRFDLDSQSFEGTPPSSESDIEKEVAVEERPVSEQL